MIPMNVADIHRYGVLLEDVTNKTRTNPEGDRLISKGTTVRILDISEGGGLLGGSTPGNKRVLVQEEGNGALWTGAWNVELVETPVPASPNRLRSTASSEVRLTYNANIHGGSIQTYVEPIFSNGPHITLDFNRELKREDLLDMSLKDAKTICRLLDLAITEAEGVQQ